MLIGGNRMLCMRFGCRSFVRNSAWLYIWNLLVFLSQRFNVLISSAVTVSVKVL